MPLVFIGLAIAAFGVWRHRKMMHRRHEPQKPPPSDTREGQTPAHVVPVNQPPPSPQPKPAPENTPANQPPPAEQSADDAQSEQTPAGNA